MRCGDHSLFMLVYDRYTVDKAIRFVETLYSQYFDICAMSQEIVKIVLLEVIEVEIIKRLQSNWS